MLEELQKLSREMIKIKKSPYRRYLFEMKPFEHRLSFLVGQRGVGKTTTIVQYLLETVSDDIFDDSILYVPVDHFLVGESSLYDIAEQFVTIGGKLLVFDEIHKYQNWSQELKSIYDTFPKLKVVVSGSSALQIHKGSHDLSRRAIKFHLYGLSFREYLELKYGFELERLTLSEILKDHLKTSSIIVSKCEQKNKKIVPLFHEYLESGYYPYFLEFSDVNHYFITLEQNLHTTLEADLASIYPHLTGASINKIKKLLVYIAKSVPFTPNWNKLKESLEIGDIRTLKTYFQYLEDSGLIRILNSNSKKFSNVYSQGKVFLDNPNQMHAFSLGKQNKGTIRELFFLNMLSLNHQLNLPPEGDFLVDDLYLFEVGGRNKSFQQIKKMPNSFLACDDIEAGSGAKIPLWLFGFLY